ncbi:nucleoside hydrolase [Phormidesmis priestleyi]
MKKLVVMSFSSVPKVILDTDPGGDDIFAFLWLQSLAKQGLVEIIAVTTTAGNVSAQKTFSSACQILELGGFAQIEVGRGMTLDGELAENAAHIHGSDGMGNLSNTLPRPAREYETARNADEVLIDQLNALPGEITLIAIGPLTNLAAAEKKSPGILQKAREIVIMGGAFFCPGNVTPQAEFNIWFDPEAAKVVLNSRTDLVILPLDVTRHLILTREMAGAIAQINPHSNLAKLIVNLSEFMIKTALSHRETSGISGFLVHDAATLSYLFYPELLMLRRSKVWVETRGEWTRGQTTIDQRNGAKQRANAWVALQVDQTKFFTSFIEDLKRLMDVLT